MAGYCAHYVTNFHLLPTKKQTSAEPLKLLFPCSHTGPSHGLEVLRISLLQPGLSGGCRRISASAPRAPPHPHRGHPCSCSLSKPGHLHPVHGSSRDTLQFPSVPCPGALSAQTHTSGSWMHPQVLVISLRMKGGKKKKGKKIFSCNISERYHLPDSNF